MKKIFVMMLVLVFLSGCTQSVAGHLNKVGRTEEVTSVTTRDLKVPVLMLHYVREVDQKKDLMGFDLSVTPVKFEKLLKLLKMNGFETVHVADLLQNRIPKKPIIITFDDGYIDYYNNAVPLLRKYGFSASEAIITGMMDGNQYMSPDQLKELAGGSTEIFSHTVKHDDLVKSNDAKTEIELSKKDLEKLLNVQVDGFVYPSGRYNEKVIALVKNAGYKYAFTTKEGVADFGGDLFQLPRIRIDNRTDFEKIFREFHLIK